MIRILWLWLIINFFDYFVIYIYEILLEFYIWNIIFRLNMNSFLVLLRFICVNWYIMLVSCIGSFDLVIWINLFFIYKCVYLGEVCDCLRKCYKSGIIVCVIWLGVIWD